MSFSKYFKPYCLKPIYLMNEKDSAGTCGFVNGIVYSCILTLLVLITGCKYYISSKNSKDKRDIVIFTCICAFIIWIILPLLFRHSEENLWDGYNEVKMQLNTDGGYSKIDIINILQSLNEGGVSSSPVVSGVAKAIFLSKVSEKVPLGPELSKVSEKVPLGPELSKVSDKVPLGPYSNEDNKKLKNNINNY